MFEMMFKSKILEEKAKPTKERKILFPMHYTENNNGEPSDSVIDIAAYRWFLILHAHP